MSDLKVLLNSYHSGANAWFAMGQARGLFEAEGLTAEFKSGPGAFQAPKVMMDGGFDLTFGDMCALTGLVAHTDEPAPTAVYAIHYHSPSAVAVPADGPIHVPADLEGRRLVTHLSDVAYRSFPAYARLAGIDREKVGIEISDASMASMLRAVLDGGGEGVFGYISSQKAVLRQVDPRLRFLPFPDIAPCLYGSIMIASRAAITAKGDALRAFLRALNQALLEAVAAPSAAVAAVVERNPSLDIAIELDRWRDTIAREMTHREIDTLGFGAMDSTRLGETAKLLAETVPFARAPVAAELFDADFLPAEADRLALTKAISAAESVSA
jgi:NitT/TauT family transport system substrate-binding protein